MIPTGSYQLIEDSLDADMEARIFMKSQGEEVPSLLGFPTVVARDTPNGEITGVLGTNLTNQIVVADPLVVRTDRLSVVRIIRLVEAYENVLRWAGVGSYHFYVEKSKPHWKSLVERATGISPRSDENAVIDENKWWYIRSL